jgi:aspartate/methionine/tyrosine aminotransferase
MFSSRTQWNMSPNRLSDLVAEKRRRREIIIDLTESNPTHCGFSYPQEDILGALAGASSLDYQPAPRGLLTAREAIAEYYAARGVTVSPEHILLTASTSEAYSFLFKLLCNVHDEILVPQPSYPLFEYLGQLHDVVLRYYCLEYDGEWNFDFESLESAYTDRVRAIILVHPNNPTGSYVKQNEFNRISSFASEHHCALIVDEVFESYNYLSNSRYQTSWISKAPVLSFSLNGISKLLGLPQLKLSWMVISSTSQDTAAVLNRLDIIADTFLSVNTPAQVALPRLLRQSHDIHGQIHMRVHSNFHLLKKIFADSSVSVFHSEGGWYAILQLPQFRRDDEWAVELLLRQNILVYPGHFFDMKQSSCIVISLLLLPDIFTDALTRIRTFVEHS